MPVLSSTPDMSAETWLGAAAWAPGSQKWSGTRPAFRPKPKSASPKTHPASGAPPSRPGHGGELVGAGQAAEQGEEREERQVAGVGRGQVDEGGALDLALLVLGEDQQEAGQRHHLPGRQEEHGVGGDADQRHGPGHQAEVELEPDRLGAALRPAASSRARRRRPGPAGPAPAARRGRRGRRPASRARPAASARGPTRRPPGPPAPAGRRRCRATAPRTSVPVASRCASAGRRRSARAQPPLLPARNAAAMIRLRLTSGNGSPLPARPP